jgi:hypothetical protein
MAHRTTLAIFGKRTEQHFQPIGNYEYIWG